LARCQFRIEYKELDTGRKVWFECTEENAETSFCSFHDEEYLRNHKNDIELIRKKIMEKIHHSISNNRPLVCIGYHIPDIRVENCQFTRPVYFSDAVFHGNLVFNNVFFQHCDFAGARFNDTTFSGVTFLKNVSFFGSLFLSGTFFHIVGFQGDAIFNETRLEEFEFVRITFEKKALFQFAEFQKGYFRGVIEFVDKADFSYARFSDVEFSPKTVFRERADFSHCIFQSRTLLHIQEFGYYTSFNSALFEEQDKTIFDVEDLSKVSFIDSDISRISFKQNPKWGSEIRFQIFDERLLEQSLFIPLFKWRSILSDGKQQERLKRFLIEDLRQDWIKIDSRLNSAEIILLR
jgi:uncharacterized protein YjbI with pentapeptide repeats